MIAGSEVRRGRTVEVYSSDGGRTWHESPRVNLTGHDILVADAALGVWLSEQDALKRERRARVTLDEWTDAWINYGGDQTLTEYIATHELPPPPPPPAHMDPGTKPTRFEERIDRLFDGLTEISLSFLRGSFFTRRGL